MKFTTKIVVSRENIDKGKCGSPRACAFAKACIDAGFTRASIGGERSDDGVWNSHVWINGAKMGITAPGLNEFITRFDATEYDNGKKRIKPRTFSATVETLAKGQQPAASSQ